MPRNLSWIWVWSTAMTTVMLLNGTRAIAQSATLLPKVNPAAMPILRLVDPKSIPPSRFSRPLSDAERNFFVSHAIVKPNDPTLRPLFHVHPMRRLGAPASPTGTKVFWGNTLINPDVNYWGSMVLSNPVVVPVFWGFKVTKGYPDPFRDSSGVMPYALNFMRSLAGSSWLATVDQYYENSGVPHVQSASLVVTNPIFDDTTDPGPKYNDAAVHAEVGRWVNNAIAGNTNEIFVVFTPEGSVNTDLVADCAAHFSDQSVSFSQMQLNYTYVTVPYMPDYGKNCGAGMVSGPLDGVSIVVGHEIAEAITNPYATFTDPTAFKSLYTGAWAAWATDPFTEGGQEIGDLCAWQGLQNTIFPNGMAFPTQPLWSNRDHLCVQQATAQAQPTGLSIFHTAQLTPGGSWGYVAPLASNVSRVSVGQNADGRLELFFLDANGEIYHMWQVTPGGTWSGIAAMSGFAKQLVVGRNQDGRLDIIYTGPDNAIYQICQTAPNSGWSGEYPIEGLAKQLNVVSANGRMFLFYVGANDALFENPQATANGDWWGETVVSNYAHVGIRQVAVGQNLDGEFDVFGIALANGAILRAGTNQTVPPPIVIGGLAVQLAVGQNADGREELFYVGTNSALFHNWQVSPLLGWNGEQPLGGFAKQLDVASNADGRLEVFYVGDNGAIFHNAQVSPNRGWAGESALVGTFAQATQVVSARNADGRLELFYVGVAGR